MRARRRFCLIVPAFFICVACGNSSEGESREEQTEQGSENLCELDFSGFVLADWSVDDYLLVSGKLEGDGKVNSFWVKADRSEVFRISTDDEDSLQVEPSPSRNFLALNRPSGQSLRVRNFRPGLGFGDVDDSVLEQIDALGEARYIHWLHDDAGFLFEFVAGGETGNSASENGTYLYDLASKELRKLSDSFLMSAAPRTLEPRISPNNRFMVSSSSALSNGELFDLETGQIKTIETELPRFPGQKEQVLFSADSRYLILLSLGINDPIYFYDTEGDEPAVPLQTAEDEALTDAQWITADSFVGSKALVWSSSGPLFIFDAESESLTLVSSVEEDSSGRRRISPRGDRVYVIAGQNDAYTYEVLDGTQIPVARGEAFWSPDGRWVAVVEDDSSSGNVENARQITLLDASNNFEEESLFQEAGGGARLRSIATLTWSERSDWLTFSVLDPASRNLDGEADERYFVGGAGNKPEKTTPEDAEGKFVSMRIGSFPYEIFSQSGEWTLTEGTTETDGNRLFTHRLGSDEYYRLNTGRDGCSVQEEQ